MNDAQMWDDFVDESPYGTIFHKWGFLKTIEKHTGHEFLPYTLYEEDTLVCIFPAFIKTNYGVNVILSPPPRTGVPYMGLVLSSEYDDLTQSGKEVRLREIIKLATEKFEGFSPIYISTQLIPAFSDIREFKWNGYSVEPLFTYYIPTDIPSDEILKGFSRSTKRLVKGIKNNKYDMKMIESTDLTLFCDLLSKRYEEQDIKVPIVGIEYLEDLMKLYPENIRLYYVYDENGNVIGSNVITMYKQKIVSWLGTPKPDVNLPVNEFIFWELIKISRDKNSMFEIGGADTRHLCSFKSRFNPLLETNYRVFRRKNLGVVAEWVYLNIYKKRSSRIRRQTSDWT
ncbi:GNAT family N-acetyltransferase [Methanolobus halotolerans]|uniref:GNAT family N-acetyltransferase n=2 Tax=Methanolobus halotolerans TaxID=2052935 RepID=A0A4E0QZS0_9EURY|nr:GNAT family N-acetyltransferase [Methanolobus halotolerans]